MKINSQKIKDTHIENFIRSIENNEFINDFILNRVRRIATPFVTSLLNNNNNFDNSNCLLKKGDKNRKRSRKLTLTVTFTGVTA